MSQLQLSGLINALTSVKLTDVRGSPMTEFKISSFCTQGGCVEVGHASDGTVIVRDSKDPLRSVSITFGDGAWMSFLSGLREGDFDGQ